MLRLVLDSVCARRTAEGCYDCGVCCSADTTCQSTYVLPANDAWGDPVTHGPLCPYMTLRNGSVINTEMMIRMVQEAQSMVQSSECQILCDDVSRVCLKCYITVGWFVMHRPVVSKPDRS